jgi:hypothetical protein
MSKDIFEELNAVAEKPKHRQNPNWHIVGRYDDFSAADECRKRLLGEGRVAKVHKLSVHFVVKVQPPPPQARPAQATTTDDNRRTGKQKRQARNEKR